MKAENDLYFFHENCLKVNSLLLLSLLNTSDHLDPNDLS